MNLTNDKAEKDLIFDKGPTNIFVTRNLARLDRKRNKQTHKHRTYIHTKKEQTSKLKDKYTNNMQEEEQCRIVRL